MIDRRREDQLYWHGHEPGHDRDEELSRYRGPMHETRDELDRRSEYERREAVRHTRDWSAGEFGPGEYRQGDYPRGHFGGYPKPYRGDELYRAGGYAAGRYRSPDYPGGGGYEGGNTAGDPYADERRRVYQGGAPPGPRSGHAGGVYGMPGGPAQGRRNRGPKGYRRSDERIKEDICERLMQDDELDLSDVGIDVQGGKVSLNGTVANRHTRYVIEEVVDNCFGVEDIENNLRVAQMEAR